MYRGYCALNLSHFPHPFSELFIDKDEGGVRFRVLPLGFHAELSFALSAKKEPVPAPDRCRKHCPSTNLCIFDIWTCAYLTYIEMSQTHCLLKHGGEFLFSIVGIFEMPLPPVDELSDDSASKAAIKSPEKPTAPAKPKSKPEKPPKQNPKEKAAKVEKKPAMSEKPQKTEKPKAAPTGKSAPMKRPAAGNSAGVADPANGPPQKKPACASKDSDRLSVCKSLYKRNGIWSVKLNGKEVIRVICMHWMFRTVTDFFACYSWVQLNRY